jgi:hypothetical protein
LVAGPFATGGGRGLGACPLIGGCGAAGGALTPGVLVCGYGFVIGYAGGPLALGEETVTDAAGVGFYTSIDSLLVGLPGITF